MNRKTHPVLCLEVLDDRTAPSTLPLISVEVNLQPYCYGCNNHAHPQPDCMGCKDHPQQLPPGIVFPPQPALLLPPQPCISTHVSPEFPPEPVHPPSPIYPPEPV